MALPNSGLRIPRQSVVGMEGMWVKMWDPPKENPDTPDNRSPSNPVPEVMAAAGLQDTPSTPHTVMRDLLHGARLSAYDSKEINFYLFRDHDNPATGGGNFPGATIRVPRGVWFHGETQGHGPPPHTIHWHGIEPTPSNDGVGHCSMEIGHYTYQWQPNFIGFYFCHCHRNTVQHFEFGLYQALLIDPPDAFFATLWNRAIPIGAGRDGLRRIAANLNIIGTETSSGSGFPGNGAGFETLTTRTDGEVQGLWPGYTGGLITDPDPEADNPSLPSYLKFPVNPHAKTVPYDVEALWVVDDRDSRWSDEAPDARMTYPKHGSIPGVDDNFHGNAGGGTDASKFFAFNDFHTDYFYVTGVNFNGTILGKNDALGNPGTGTGTIPSDIVIPPALICGTATQVPITANVNQTILVRCLDAAYNCAHVTFPVPVTIIGWDGRALGVEPFNAYNHAYEVPAGTPIHISVARRFDALIRVASPVNGAATIEFTDTRAGTEDGYDEPIRFTGSIPINIGYGISGRITEGIAPVNGVTVTLSGAASRTAVTDDTGSYSIKGLPNGDYTVTPSLAGFDFTPAIVTIGGDNLVQDFTTAQAAGFYTISGFLFESRGGGAISGNISAANPGGMPVTVALTGPVTRTAIPDSLGRYAFTGLVDGSYVVTPSSAAYNFRPQQRTVTISGANREASFRARIASVPVI